MYLGAEEETVRTCPHDPHALVALLEELAVLCSLEGIRLTSLVVCVNRVRSDVVEEACSAKKKSTIAHHIYGNGERSPVGSTISDYIFTALLPSAFLLLQINLLSMVQSTQMVVTSSHSLCLLVQLEA